MSDASHIQKWIVARAGAWRNNVKNIASWRTQRRASVTDALHALEAYRGLARDRAISPPLGESRPAAAQLPVWNPFMDNYTR
jgi:hypothetical protein